MLIYSLVNEASFVSDLRSNCSLRVCSASTRTYRPSRNIYGTSSYRSGWVDSHTQQFTAMLLLPCTTPSIFSLERLPMPSHHCSCHAWCYPSTSFLVFILPGSGWVHFYAQNNWQQCNILFVCVCKIINMFGVPIIAGSPYALHFFRVWTSTFNRHSVVQDVGIKIKAVYCQVMSTKNLHVLAYIIHTYILTLA